MTARPPMVDLLARATADLGPPPDPVAELLVALAHDNRDRDVWGGDRAITYWDRLPDRIRAACYFGPTLAHWWERACAQLGSTHPTRKEDREALARALACGRDSQVLDTIRANTETLCLRVRLAIQQHYDDQPDPPKKAAKADTQESML